MPSMCTTPARSNAALILVAPLVLLTVTCFTTTTGRPYDNHGGDMTHIDQDLSAALCLLGFSLLRGDLGEIAEIKGDMTIKLVHPPGEELKLVVELPGEKQMIFSVDRHQIVSLAERWN